VELNEGWNLVSFEGTPGSAGRQARVLAAVTGGATAIYTYDPQNDRWSGHHSSGPSFANSLGVLVPGHDYWVWVEGPGAWQQPDGALNLIAFTLTGSIGEEDGARLGPGVTGDLVTALTVIPPEGGGTATIASFDGPSRGFAWSHSGTRLAWCSDAGLEVAFGDGSGRETLYEGACDQPAWSDGDRWLAFAAEIAQGTDILAVEAMSGESDNLTDDPAGNYSAPAWRPGTDDVYAVRRGATTDFGDDAVVALRAGSSPEPVLGGQRRDLAFSPDGGHLYSTLQQGGQLSARALDLEDGDEETLVNSGRALTASPDGQYIAWRDPNSVRLRPAGGGATLAPVITDRVFAYSWSADSRQLAVTLDDDLRKGVLAVTSLTGPPEIIAGYPPLNITEPRWSPE
jgi:hypothetical protein